MPALTPGEHPAPAPLDTLSPLARALAQRSMAQLVVEARVGPPHILREVASRYRDAIPELAASGREPMAVVLAVQASKADRLAREIECLLRRPNRAPWLREVLASEGCP